MRRETGPTPVWDSGTQNTTEAVSSSSLPFYELILVLYYFLFRVFPKLSGIHSSISLGFEERWNLQLTFRIMSQTEILAPEDVGDAEPGVILWDVTAPHHVLPSETRQVPTCHSPL